MRLTLNEMPVKCLDWLVTSRIKFLDSMRNGDPTKYFAAHLPTMATWSDADPELRPLVDEAMERIAVLAGEPRG